MNKILAYIFIGFICLGCEPNNSSLNETNSAQSSETNNQAMSSFLTAPSSPKPPMAKQQPYQIEYHGITLSDPYHWLKDQSYPEVDDDDVLSYLHEENAYFNQFMDQHKSLVDRLYEEFTGRENQEESAVPWKEGEYLYRWYYQPGNEYRVWARTKIGEDHTVEDNEEIILNENVLAEGQEYHRLASFDVSPNGRYLAYAIDNNGSERYTIHIKDLTTGDLLKDTISETSGDTEWTSDSQTLLYIVVSKEWRPYLVKSHTLGTDANTDNTLFEETDTGFFVGIDKTQSGEFMLIHTGNQVVSEVHAIPANNVSQPLMAFASRDKEIEYYVDHAHEQFYIRTNDNHVNFRLVSTPDDTPQYDNWETLIEGSDNYYLTGFLPLKQTLVLVGKRNGLDEITLRDYSGEEKTLSFPESVYAVGLGTNPEFETNHLRLEYESMITPESTYDYQFTDGSLELRKQQVIPSGYDKNQYHTERLMAPARDGALIPISIVYKKDFKKDGSHPMHLYGYGAYGSGMDPGFSTTQLSLIDRGFSYAIAHVRGGDEMGYQWYLDGKLEKRQNTFNDFIDVGKFLIENNYVSKGNISISGGSAGGELMGAVIVQEPELWKSVNLIVPFVDVLNTMLDTSLPLTPIEWPEWGNPIESKQDYETIAAYSPYDNIEARDYPPMFVAGGLNDPRVTYWEPAKWTAKMRATKTDNNLLLMRMHMGAGHFSSSGRFARLKDDAEEYTFMLLAHGITE